jgi:hypothetical protein
MGLLSCNVYELKENIMATATQSYAAQRNAVYLNSSSNLVDLVKRLNDTIAAMPVQAQRNWQAKLAKALATFKKNHPGLKSINDPKRFRLCKSLVGKLKDIVIDTTMQREPNLQWIITIIENFRAYQAQPIQVYASGDQWGGWDGQHTSIALYLISVHGLGEKFEDVEVPINVYDIASRGELRSNFINNNTTVGKNAGKKPLDIIDIIQQMIYGVEVDGVNEPEWKDAHAKWKALANAGMFMTADKFNDTDQTGAISRLNEINDSSVGVVKKFAIYGKYVVDLQQRPINTKEIPIIMEFFNLCEQQDIEYTEAEIEDLAQHCVNLFDANFDARGPFWDQVHQANINAWTKHNKSKDKRDWTDPPRNSKNVPQGIAFFWHQLRNTWAPTQASGFKFPKQPFSVYTPDAKDLF